MRDYKATSLILILCIGFSLTASSQKSYKSDVTTILVNFDKSYMQKYEYQTDREYLVEDNYTNYNFPIDEARTLVFKVVAKEKAPATVSTSNYDIFSLEKAKQVDRGFVKRVNTGATVIYISESGTNTNQIYKVDKITYIEDDGKQLNYFAYPHSSFFYNYQDYHYPVQELYPIQLGGDQFETRTYFSQKTTELEHDKLVFLKMYREVCANRSFGLATNRTQPNETVKDVNADLALSGSKLVMRTCQHAITMEYIPKIGIIRESYEELGKQFHSKLTTINDIPLQTYLLTYSPKGSALPASQLYAAYEDNDDNIMAFASKGDSRIKGKEIPALEIKSEEKLITIGREIISKPTNAESAYSHKVQTGDTLYNLSRKYGVSVSDIRQLNGIVDNIIKIGQELRIR